MANGLNEFKDVMKEVNSITSWGVKISIVAPLSDLILDIGPPWPGGVSIISSLVCLITVISIFNFWSKKRKNLLKRFMVISLALFALSFMGYMYLYGNFTFVPPWSKNRFVRGFVPRHEVKLVLTEVYTEDDAFRDSGKHPEKVWTNSSISAMRYLIFINWMLIFISLSSFLTIFVIQQRRELH